MLGQMADQKANIIIGVSLIYFSMLGARIAGEGLANPHYAVPLSILSLAIFAAFFLAIIVVIPRARTQVYGDPGDMGNPLFFGSFASCPEDAYARYMLERLRDDESARDLLLRDMHQIGVVLKRKYRLLKYAYGSLALGVLITAPMLAVLAKL